MTISQTQLVDILYKKLSGVSKTDTSTAKSPANESIASPQLAPGSVIWQQDYLIPSVTTLPTSNSSVVSVYSSTTSSVVQATALSESVSQETWATNLTNWISPQFGAGYQLKLYAGPPGATSSQAVNFTNLPVGGSGNSDSWYFDYIAGVVNFADTNVPTPVANVANVVYAVGARYTGTLGITNFGNLNIGNIVVNGNTISSTNGNIFLGNISSVKIAGGQPTFVISTDGSGNLNFANVDAIIGNTLQQLGTLSNLTISGNLSTSNVLIGGGFFYPNGSPYSFGTYSNVNVNQYLPTYTGNLNPAAVTSTFYGNISADLISPNLTNATVFNSSTAVGIPVGPSSARPSNPQTGYLRYNTDLNSVEVYNGTTWYPLANEIQEQNINGDGSTHTFTLDQITTAGGILVSINGTVQNPNTAYTVTGNQITFSETPQSTDVIDIRFLSVEVALSSAISGNLSVSGNLVINNTITWANGAPYSLVANVNTNSIAVSTPNVLVGNTITIVDTWSSSQYRSAKYVITSTNPWDSQMTDVMVLQNNSTAIITAYGILNTGANIILYSANVAGGSVNLLAQGTSGADNLRIQSTYFDI
jgi:hypothetical protein